MANVWEDAFSIPGMRDWIPDEWQSPKKIDRKFFWAILTTEHPQYVEALIRGAQNARAERKKQQLVQPTFIQPTPEWIQMLLDQAGFHQSGK